MNHYKVLVSITLEFNILANSEEDAEDLIAQSDKPDLFGYALYESIVVDSCNEVHRDEASFADTNWVPC